MDLQNELTLVKNFIIDEFGDSAEFVIYGSFMEAKNGFLVDPKDIDVALVNYYGLSETIRVKIPNFDIPLEITPMYTADFIKELEELEPKYFNFHASSIGLHSMIYDELDKKRGWEVRSQISSITSKAYNKGKKKLIVENDYDEYLGLKNLYHAFKFPVNAIWYYFNLDNGDIDTLTTIKHNHVWYLKDIHDIIFDTYNNSTGTLEERWKTLDAVIKPRYNKLMTDFRIRFPKKVD